MLLQEKHNFDLYDGKYVEEDSSKSHLECSNNNGTCIQHRSTFDLSSFHRSSSTLSSASSSTNTLYVSFPKSQRTYVRNNTTLRFRGPLSTSLEEDGNTSSVTTRSTKNQDESTSTSSGVTISNNTSNQNTTSNINANNNRNDDEDGSVVESTLGGNFLGCGHLIVILLHMIVTIERFVRRIFREVGFVYASIFASSSSFQQEPVNDDEDELSSSTSAPPMQDADEDYSSSSDSSSSSSSSSGDDEHDEHQIDADGWGHFADFQEELADESSFIPSCSRSNNVVRPYRSVTPPSPDNQKGALETLTESREEEDEEDWSF
jgi:hypothetical protein